MAKAAPFPLSEAAVVEYKKILTDVLETRPSGTRQRLAAALGKNRSFISQITNPAYATPIPANHIDLIFEICHFSMDAKRRFLDAYRRGHPRRLQLVQEHPRLKAHTIYLPDLGDEARNEKLHTLVADFVRQMAGVIREE